MTNSSLLNIKSDKCFLHRWRCAGVFAGALLGCTGALAGKFNTDFNSGTPAGSAVNGTAVVDATGGVNNSGVLKLTTADNSQQGSFVLDDLDGGAVVSGFNASFRLLIGGGNGADGFSFSFGPDIADVFGEEGSGTGLTVSFDTYDNGNAEAPAIDLKSGGVQVAHTPVDVGFLRQNTFVDVNILVNTDGTVNLVFAGQTIYTNFYGAFVNTNFVRAFVPTAGRFGFGARTGGLNDNHWVDNLSITTSTSPGTTPNHPLVLNASPTGGPLTPLLNISITLLDLGTQVDTNSILLSLNGTAATPKVSKAQDITTVSYDTPLLSSNSTNVYALIFKDNAKPPVSYTNKWAFNVIGYTNKVLPAPLYFEDFEKATLGGLPSGWTATNHTDSINAGNDIGDPGSDLYMNWLVIDRNQVFVNGTNDFHGWEAGDPDGRVTHIAPGQVVNGKVLTADDLMVGKFVFAESDERGGGQIQMLFSPDYDLTGKSDIWISYHSSYTQNQDSLGATEYSIDKGKTWLPVSYFLYGKGPVTSQGGSRIAYNTNATTGAVTVDAVGTFTGYVRNGYLDTSIDPHAQNDTPQVDGTFTTWDQFIEARPLESLAPYIEGRVNDDTFESHRVELYPLPAAANQKSVRLRFVSIGTGSWYWGFDNFGIYSIPSAGPQIKTAVAGNKVTISWDAAASGFTLESTASLSAPSWKAVAGVANNSVTISVTAGNAFYRLRK